MADKITSNEVIEAKQLVKDIGDVEKAFASLLSQMKLVTAESGNFKTQGQGNKTIQTRIQLEGQAGALIKERARLEAALTREQAKRTQAGRTVNANLQKERVAVRALNKEQREAATLTSKYVGAYQKLNLQRTIASRTLRDLLASEKASNEEIEKAQRNFDKLDAKVRKADAAVRDSTKNVGNYKSAFQGIAGTFRQLVGAFGLIEGLRLGFSLTKDAIELAKEARGVEFAFNRIENSVQILNEARKATRGFASDLDIQRSVVQLDNFNLGVEDTATLLEFASVRAAQTGDNVGRLVEQIVLGLGRQSVQRLDDLGITQARINEEVDKGKDFMQAFVDLATEGIAEAGDILDEAGNSTERWNAATENLQVSFGKLAGGFPGLSAASGIVESLARQFTQINFALNEQLTLRQRLQVIVRSSFISGQAQNQLLIEEAEARKEVARQVDEQNRSYVRLNGSLAPLLQNQKAVIEQFDLSGPIRNVEFLNTAIETLNEKLLQTSSRDEAEAIQKQIEALEKERDAILGVNEEKKKTQTLIEGTISYYNDLIAKETQFQQNEARTADAISLSKDRVKEYEEAIDKLNSVFEKLEKVEISFSAAGTGDLQKQFEDIASPFGLDENVDFSIISKTFEDLKNESKSAVDQFVEDYRNGERIKVEEAQKSADKQAEIIRSVFQEFQTLYGVDATAFSNLFDSKKNDVSDFANAAIELNNLLFNIAEENRQQDLENARAALDRTLENEEASEEQKAAAQEKYRKEEAKIKKKSFEANKKAAILNIQISTAQAILQAYAQLGPIGGTIAGVIITALGLAKTAVVASKKPPKYFKGTQNATEGWAWTDEQGPELHLDKKGNIKDFGSDKGPRLKWLNDGDQIITAPNTKAILNQGHSERLAYKERQSDNRLYEEVRGLRREMSRYASRVPQLNVNAKVEQPITGY